jgi:serine/threonine protein kinase
LITFQSLFYSNDVDEVTMLNQACVIEFDIPQLETVSDECLTLLKSMLAKDPQERISTEDALIHPWFSSS